MTHAYDAGSTQVHGSTISGGGHVIIGGQGHSITTSDAHAAVSPRNDAELLTAIVALATRASDAETLSAHEISTLRSLMADAEANGGTLSADGQQVSRGMFSRVLGLLQGAGEKVLTTAFMSMVGLG